MINKLATPEWVYLSEGDIAGKWLPSEVAEFVVLSSFFPSLFPQHHTSFQQAMIITWSYKVREFWLGFITDRVESGQLLCLLVLSNFLQVLLLLSLVMVNGLQLCWRFKRGSRRLLICFDEELLVFFRFFDWDRSFFWCDWFLNFWWKFR